MAPGVYISYPFCAQKCTFCNFASGVFSRELEHAYLDALVREMEAHVWTEPPDTVYLGGGTPSRMPVSDLQRVLAAIPGRPWREATIEAAPGTITAEAAAGWRELGLTRVSLGVQSFAAAELARTGRRHTAEVVARDVDLLRGAGIGNFNIDLIAGLPGQTAASWSASLDCVERLRAPHASVYMFEVDEDSRLGREVLFHGVRYGAPDVPGDDAIAALYETAVERLAACGLARYEISNFARPGCESAHNLKYWRLEPYFGFGADAHSFDGVWRWQNAESAQEYVLLSSQPATICCGAGSQPAAASQAALLPVCGSAALWGIPPACVGLSAPPVPGLSRVPANLAEERFFVGLRLLEGIQPAPEEWSRHDAAISRFQRDGLLVRDGPRLRLTSRGVLLSNEVFEEFIH
ncbi:MAG: radical SAM family heme chaperone HemW [Bryobacteraceae bacterium]